MKTCLAVGVLLMGALGVNSLAQTGGGRFPSAALAAKTVAVVNDTHNAEVEKGAESALKAWGQFRLTDDAENADLTLRFDKESEHSGTSAQKTGDDGKPSYSYGLSFGSSIHMRAYTKDGTAPFYTAKTGDSKQKAGVACVNDFREVFRAERAR